MCLKTLSGRQLSLLSSIRQSNGRMAATLENQAFSFTGTCATSGLPSLIEAFFASRSF
jgi:hypothetical protein